MRNTRRETGLLPIYQTDARLLILGSFPSPASLQAQQYYGHPRNQFWRLLGASIGETLAEFSYTERIRRLAARQIAIWDIYQSCARPGALDSDIRAGLVNDFPALFPKLPSLKYLCFNGKTAGKFAPRLAALYADLYGRALAYCVLPSSSPAYTLAFAEKKARWQEAIGDCKGL